MTPRASALCSGFSTSFVLGMATWEDPELGLLLAMLAAMGGAAFLFAWDELSTREGIFPPA